jgi:hypothetical protein
LAAILGSSSADSLTIVGTTTATTVTRASSTPESVTFNGLGAGTQLSVSSFGGDDAVDASNSPRPVSFFVSTSGSAHFTASQFDDLIGVSGPATVRADGGAGSDRYSLNNPPS